MSTSLITATDLLSSLKLRTPSTIQVPRAPRLDMAVKLSRNPQIENHSGMLSPCRNGIGTVGEARIDWKN